MGLEITYNEKKDLKGPQYWEAFLGQVHIATIYYSQRDDEHYIVKWFLSNSNQHYAQNFDDAKTFVYLNLENWLHKTGIYAKVAGQ